MDTSKIARIIGATLGVTVVGCLALCICGGAVAATVKFLMWIF